MLIKKFTAPASELNDVALQSIEINKLGRFVALTGKNGAGKSRIQIIAGIDRTVLYQQTEGFFDFIKVIPQLPSLANSLRKILATQYDIVQCKREYK